MIIRFFDLLFTFLEYAIFLDVILSWVARGRDNKFTEIIHIITEPFLMPGRILQERLVPGLMIDFSPIVAFLIIGFLKKLVIIILSFI
ncbi:YggT family protein [Haloimpatiens sp. FM7315]|uniref:YggT family protein n=1 Tax=Haloimpatiens sp. FM7315 TaxID=3298609 RepID=UPI0035A2DA5B